MPQQHYGRAFGGSAPENYERYFVPVIPAPLAAELLDAVAPRLGERVLDVACGTGIVARLAAERVGPTGKVTGIDLTPGMLEVAKNATPPGRAIDWHEASAEAMPLPDEAFDVVVCQLGLMFVPDKAAAVREMKRVLVSGGRLGINVPGPTPPLFAIVDEALQRHVGSEAAGFVGAVFSLNDPGEIRDLIAGAGFRDVRVRKSARKLPLPPPGEFLWQYVHSTPLAGIMAKVDDQKRASLEREVVERLRPFVQDGGLIFEFDLAVATALKQA
jgi:ubiquinone/menaquinone biosynthesis C-methylase UbiE